MVGQPWQKSLFIIQFVDLNYNIQFSIYYRREDIFANKKKFMTPIFRSLILVSLLFPVTIINAQTSDSSINELAEKWRHAKNYTIKMAQLMPEELYDFKPVAEEMTFREQLVHISQNIYGLSAIINGRKSSFTRPSNLSKTEVIALVSTAYDTGMTTHTNLPSIKLADQVPFFAGPKTRRQVLVTMHDHQTHHMGQLIVYARLKGIKPPDYIGW